MSDRVECVSLPGRGQGLVAKQALQIGEVILRENPMVEMPLSVFDLPDSDRIDRRLDRKINAMTAIQRQQYFDLSDCQSEGDTNLDKTPLGIFYTNCMEFMEDTLAVFPKIARCNHSCEPNCEFVTNKPLKAQELIAVKQIKEGTEVTISYLPANREGSDIRKIRHDYLKEKYGFNCICSACSNSSNELIRSRVRALQKRSPNHCHLSLLEMEELADGLEMIGSKVCHLEETFRRLLDRAVEENDNVLAHKCFSSVYIYKTILSCPDVEEWKANFQRMKSVTINGKTYFFSPDVDIK